MAYFVGIAVVLLLVQCNSAERDGASPASSPASAPSAGGQKKDARCEEITIPMCKGIGYNWTSMPNSLHHGKSRSTGAHSRSRCPDQSGPS